MSIPMHDLSRELYKSLEESDTDAIGEIAAGGQGDDEWTPEAIEDATSEESKKNFKTSIAKQNLKDSIAKINQGTIMGDLQMKAKGQKTQATSTPVKTVS